MATPRRASPLRVLHGPTDTAGHPTGLARAERRLGIESTVAVVERSRYGFDVDVDLELGGRGRAARLARRARFGLAAARRYDIFHFNFGQTWLPRLGPIGIDLPLLRALGKRLFMTFQGCDARRTGYCRDHYEISCCGRDSGEGLCRVEQDGAKARAVAHARRHCHRVFCLNPDLLRVVPDAEFVPYASVDVHALTPGPGAGPGQASRRPFTILHAPTHRRLKGTDLVTRAVETLGRDYDVKLELVENLPHAEALARYHEADLAIDQMKVGWYGSFAVEMMALGTPVVCYVRAEDLELVPTAMADALPIIRATPSGLAQVLGDLLAQRESLAGIGARSRAYALEWHDPMRVARRMVDVYEDPTLPFWDESGRLPAAGTNEAAARPASPELQSPPEVGSAS